MDKAYLGLLGLSLFVGILAGSLAVVTPLYSIGYAPTLFGITEEAYWFLAGVGMFSAVVIFGIILSASNKKTPL